MLKSLLGSWALYSASPLSLSGHKEPLSGAPAPHASSARKQSSLKRHSHHADVMAGHLRTVMDMFAPDEFKGKVIEFADSPKEADRQLRYRERNPTYKPSHNGPGYLSVVFYESHTPASAPGVDPCGGDLMAQAEWGFLSGSCFVARDHHGSDVLGSWKVGIVEASSGRNHIHVESYASPDCTGDARRTANHLDRLHYFDGQKFLTSPDPRSRSYFNNADDDDMYSTDDGGADDGGWHPQYCYKLDEHPLPTGGMIHSCNIPSGTGFFHFPGACMEKAPLRYGIWHSEFGSCFSDSDGWSYVSQCSPEGGSYGQEYYNPNGPSHCEPEYVSDNWGDGMPDCRPLHPGNDDYGGEPSLEGWDMPGHPKYNTLKQMLFSKSAEGSSIEGSSMSVEFRCFQNPPCY